MYTGHIYNNDGKVLEGIKVSDGRNIAVTDSDGFYSLPGWEKANVISVQILTNHHDDWFRYIDKEHFVYDFYISPYYNINEASFLHFSDTEIFIDHASADQWIDFVKNVKDECKPDFIIHTGDICRRRGLEYHRYAMNSDNMGIPVRYTLGNHDYVNDKYGEYTFERLYGPIWYSFDLGNVHFIALPITKGEAASLYKKDEMIVWLKNDLAEMDKTKRPIFLCHEPCGNFEQECTLHGESKEIDLKNYDALAWVFGHLHIDFLSENDGRFHIGTGRPDTGGIDGSPAGCRSIKITVDHKLSTKIIYNEATPKDTEVKRFKIAKNFCFTSPIYADEKVFVSAFDDGYPRDCAIIALTADGKELWKYETESSVKWNLCYENETVFAKDDFGIVYAISSKDGTLVWKKKLTMPHVVGASGGLIVKDGEIYVSSNERAYIIDSKNGDVLTESEYVERNSSSAPTSPVLVGSKVLWGKHWRGLICFERESGKTLWHNKDTVDSIAEPIVAGDAIYAPTRYRIAKLDMDGNILAESEKRSEKFFNSTSTPLYHKGKLFVPTTECGLGVYDAETLEIIKYIPTSPSLIAAAPYNPIGEQTVFGKPSIINNTLVFAAADGKVYFCDPESCEILRTVSIGHPILSGVAETDNGYFVCDFDGGLSFIKK